MDYLNFQSFNSSGNHFNHIEANVGRHSLNSHSLNDRRLMIFDPKVCQFYLILTMHKGKIVLKSKSTEPTIKMENRKITGFLNVHRWITNLRLSQIYKSFVSLSLHTNQRSGTADQRSFKRALNNCHHVKPTAAGKNESEMENPFCSLCKIQSFKQITNSCFWAF